MGMEKQNRPYRIMCSFECGGGGGDVDNYTNTGTGDNSTLPPQPETQLQPWSTWDHTPDLGKTRLQHDT